MNDSFEKQAFLIVTQETSKHVLKLYREIQQAVNGLGDVFLLYHGKTNDTPQVPEGVKLDVFTNDVLKSSGYKPIRTKLVPGSNHFPVLRFFLNHPQYSQYWCIEDDVTFSGTWRALFAGIPEGVGTDFVTSHIRRYSDLPDWFWWDTYREPGKDFEPEKLINSFNPAYRISNKALAFIDKSLKNGFRGHHEVLLPTLLHNAGFSIADFGAKENHVTPHLSFCTLGTMRWKPVFLKKGNLKNKLYHPVKSKITLSQLMELAKRTYKGKTEYLT